MKQAFAGIVVLVFFLYPSSAAAQISWVPVVGSTATTPAGFVDTDNTIAMSSAVLDGELYIGTFNFMFGSEVWRSSDGSSWSQVNTDGFGGAEPANNVTAYSMEVFNSKVYAATWASGLPSTPGADTKVWRYDDLQAWPQANSDGFSDSSNAEPWAMEVFPGTTPFLFVGVANHPDGAELWRAHNGVSWLQANIDGFGNVDNKEIASLTYFAGHLYAATYNDVTGLEVWRTDAPANTWTEVNATTGFGGADHYAAYAMAVFDGQLYLSTFNYTSGGTVYSTSDGLVWAEVAQAQDGFGDANNWGSYAMAAHDGALYLGTFNWTTGAEVWRTTNGTNWSQVNIDGFGIQKNYGVISWAELDGVLYATLRNDEGCQVWKNTLFSDGFESGGTTAWSSSIP